MSALLLKGLLLLLLFYSYFLQRKMQKKSAKMTKINGFGAIGQTVRTDYSCKDITLIILNAWIFEYRLCRLLSINQVQKR